MAKNRAIVDDIIIDNVDFNKYLFKNPSIIVVVAIFFISISMVFFTSIKIMYIFLLMLSTLPIMILTIISAFKSEKNGKKLDEFFVENTPDKNYFLNFGTLIYKHTDGGARTDLMDQSNIIAPLLFDEEWVRRHIDLPGTTGSGKTVFVKSLIQQIIREIGSGFCMIEGKGANDMKHEIYAEVVTSKRVNDFFILDFMNPHLSNTLNPLEYGDHIEITDFFMDMLSNGKENDNWAEGAKTLFSAVLKTLLSLRDGDMVWNPKYSNDIHTVADIERYKSKASILVLEEILLTPYSVIDFASAIQRVYDNDSFKFIKNLSKEQHKNLTKNTTINTSIDQHVYIHQPLINEIMKQTKEVPSFKDLVKNGIQAIIEKSGASDQVLYVMSVSLNQYSSVFGTFVKEFGKIFAVADGDINVKDIINNGKILYVILQGINPNKAGLIGKFMLSSIRMAAKERGTKKGLLFPFPIFLDEFNSWSKGIEGFPDLMSVTRSLGLTFFLMHQSELSKIDDGKGIESGQARANMNITILLKTEDEKIVEELLKKVGKIKKVRRDIKIDMGKKEDTGIQHSYRVEEEDAFTASDVSNLKPGQAFCIVGGKAYPMVTSFIADNTVYEIDDELPIPINKMIPKNYEAMKAFLEESSRVVKEETIIVAVKKINENNVQLLSVSIKILDKDNRLKKEYNKYYLDNSMVVSNKNLDALNAKNEIATEKYFINDDKIFYLDIFNKANKVVYKDETVFEILPHEISKMKFEKFSIIDENIKLGKVTKLPNGKLKQEKPSLEFILQKMNINENVFTIENAIEENRILEIVYKKMIGLDEDEY